MMQKQTRWFFSVSFLLTVASVASALVITSDKGNWPAGWPKELEPLRASARTIEVAAGNQENIYEVTFTDREAFEKAWPAILSLKTPGAPLTLSKFNPDSPKDSGSLLRNVAPIVRIYGPCTDVSVPGPDGKPVKLGTAWPKNLLGPKGELPEYVQNKIVDSKMQWTAIDKADKSAGFEYRARIDLELVVDGKVIDLNRIALPGDTPIIDKRF